MKRIAVGSDHRGVEMCQLLTDTLVAEGHDAVAVPSSNDYPDVAGEVARRVAQGDADVGILLCGTGIGMSIAANKFTGVRAVTCANQVVAEISRRHNDANVLCLSANLLGRDVLFGIVRHWLNAPYDGGRHDQRLAKIVDIEKRIGLS
ncbi:MAG: ribose 5-phosphate isomerase B [Thermoguttaceae bacterium]